MRNPYTKYLIKTVKFLTQNFQDKFVVNKAENDRR